MVRQQRIPERFWCVKGIDIFQDLTETDADALARITTFTQLKHADTLSAKGVYLLKEGRIKIYQTPPEGESVTLDVLDPGEFFGAVRWEDNDAHPNVTAEVLTEAEVGVVSAKNFHYFLKRKPHLSMPPRQTFAGFIKKHLRWCSTESENVNLLTPPRKSRQRMTNPFLNIAFRCPASRLALLLQNCAEASKRGGTMTGRGSQCAIRKLSTKRLAQLIGSSVEKMETLLNQFKQHGIIKKRFRRIQILDPWQLKKIANARMETLLPETPITQENTQTYEQEEPLFATRPADGR